MFVSLPTAMRGFGPASFLLAVASCSTPISEPVQDVRAPLCTTESVKVFTDFDGAGMHDCTVEGERTIRLLVNHELDRNDRINPSPWYAFEVHETGDDPVSVILDYQDFEHRYTPYLRQTGQSWQPLPPTGYSVSEDQHQTVLTLDDAHDGVVVAGQPFQTSSEIQNQYEDLTADFGLELIEIGQSRQGRPIHAILAGNPISDQLVVGLTRQHPPEITGALAFDAFAELILERLSESDTPDFRLVLFPNVNPDGIDNGHWRNNVGGWDTNRNWFEAGEPEISAVQEVIRNEARDRDVIAFMDFHSTWETLVYTHPFDDEATDMRFAGALRDDLNAALDPSPEWIVGHNIINGTSKNWAKLEFQTGGITIELADTEEDLVINTIAERVVDNIFLIANSKN